jgi:ATP-binding cassette subfamily F protein uup
MTLGALEELILSLKGAALVVSHDRYFLDKIATSVIAFDGKGAAIVLQGGYSAYTEWKNQTKKEVTISVPKTKSSKAVPKKLTYAEEIELAGLMEAIESLATQVAALEEKLGDPELHIARRDEAKAVEEDLAALRLQLDEQESRWLELEEKRQG